MTRLNIITVIPEAEIWHRTIFPLETDMMVGSKRIIVAFKMF